MRGRTTTFFAALLIFSSSIGCGDMEGIAVGMPPDTQTGDDSSSGENGATPQSGDDTGTAVTPPTDSVDDTGTSADTGTPPDTGTGALQDTGTGLPPDTGTGVPPDTGTGEPPDTGTGEPLDTETSALTEVPLIFPDGWIGQESNILGVQGSWYYFSDGLSTLFMTVQNEDSICMEGTSIEPADGDYPLHWGAKAGFDLCANVPNWVAGKTAYSLETCPWADNLPSKIVGITFQVAGTLPSGELRLQLAEQNREDGTYIVLDNNSTFTGYFEDAALFYDTSAPPLNINEVYSVMFYIPSSQPGSYDFCLFNIRLLAAL